MQNDEYESEQKSEGDQKSEEAIAGANLKAQIEEFKQ
jgi:hypothetical protein